ncbi:hypothetical protein ABT116_01805 [Streptomyces sp. NPDC002130]|uniref:hypothetical protein n=1 Tax=Streptomyces sp. NPDC002130 TaxID=3155568 RepID=UPI00331D62F5
MGIRTFLSRTGPGVALQPVPAFEAAASTVRVPVTFSTALRQATAGLRQRLAVGGRRSAASADLAAPKALPGAGGLTAAPALTGTDPLTALTGLVGIDAVAALTRLVGTEVVADLAGAVDLAALTGLVGAGTASAGSGPRPVTGPAPIELRLPGPPGTQGKPSRPWARLARDYLTLVLTLLPRPRPAHTTITVYITTADGVVSERPGGSAP